MIGDRILLNFGVYLDGYGYLGEASEVQLPKITLKTAELSAAGISGIIEVDLGKVEKMESSFKLKGVHIKPINALGLGNSIPLILRAAIKNADGTIKQIIIEMRGLIKEIDHGTFNSEDMGETSVLMSVHYYRLSEDNEDIIEIDPMNNIRKINGENSLADSIKAIN
ncbi:phage major tail tube protein [Thiotrichales bacterium 19X7-9]|nr:phage major tail tube protein [Thiotrichales bacterium 19X7-9]TNF69318.1 MAG: phage major tail tube protein [Gammaproteobacteria bacterium]UTW43803.1 phage major tail tube protein [bacterium SCSIO 12844]